MTGVKATIDTETGSDTLVCDTGSGGVGSDTSVSGLASAGTGSTIGKRKYGRKKAAVEGKTLLVTKDKKIRQSQACDRCRLKKIKCDGLKPSCSQCVRANFKCSTSDRLTRRGFPRGYTEMLEKEVVRLQKVVDGARGGALGGRCETGGDVGREGEGQGEGEGEGGSGTEPQLPFINDTFHYYNNYHCDESFLGHCTWSLLLNQGLGSSQSVAPNYEWLNEQNLVSIINFLRLDDANRALPKFLMNRHKNESKKLRKLILKAIHRFGKFQNSLVPLLQPFDQWELRFSQILTSKVAQPTPDATALLALMYIIQLSWSCFDEFKLFQVTKMICASSKTSLEQLQVLLLGSYYFMGGLTRNSGDEIDAKIWSTELLHQSYSTVLNLGLYINSHRLVPTKKENVGYISHETRVITFWSFQFLDSLWSLLQGSPKLNFLVDEFHPQSLSSLEKTSNNSFLKPFTLLSSLIVESLDGCNLMYTLSDNSNHAKSQLVYSTESFRRVLKKLKLYHHLQDHENHIDYKNLLNSVSLTKPDIVEIQLTLFYLIISFFTGEMAGTSDEKAKKGDTNMEDIAYEILSLYYLLMIDDTPSDQPSQLNILHILPCSNSEIINACINRLNSWAISLSDLSELDGQLKWKYNKYQEFLTQWCRLFYYDETDNSIFQQLLSCYKIELKPNGDLLLKEKWSKNEYLKSVVNFNNSDIPSKRSNLIRSNSNAVMNKDQFDMFSHSNSLKHFFSNSQSRDNFEQSSISKEDNNIIDMSNFKSQILIPNEESDDDGYAEDDDDDDDDESSMKPLEFPFRTKRTGSLFQNKHNLPPLYHQNCDQGLQQDGNKNSCSLSQDKRRTLDHIILGNKSFISQDDEPPTKVRHESVDSERTKAGDTQPFDSYSKYSLVAPPTKKSLSTEGSSSTAIDGQGLILPPPPPTYHDPLLGHSLGYRKGSNNQMNADIAKNAPQIVETPRAFVDMLLLPSPNQSKTALNRVSSKPQITTSNDFFKRS